MKKVLTIAGSDCSGGAGIQADIKTMCAHKVYGMSVITSLTAQNTTGVTGIFPASPAFVEQQMDAVFSDIRPDAVKIGMVGDKRTIEAIGRKLTEYKPDYIVLDPVMISTSGSRLLEEDAQNALMNILFPLADILTPNIPEASHLSGNPIHSKADMEKAAIQIKPFTKGAVLLKGGHLDEDASDLLFDGSRHTWLPADRIQTDNTHGTGCTLSSAIACNLAQGHSIVESVRLGKEYVFTLLGQKLDLGSGNGPLNHTAI